MTVDPDHYGNGNDDEWAKSALIVVCVMLGAFLALWLGVP